MHYFKKENIVTFGFFSAQFTNSHIFASKKRERERERERESEREREYKQNQGASEMIRTTEHK